MTRNHLVSGYLVLAKRVYQLSPTFDDGRHCISIKVSASAHSKFCYPASGKPIHLISAMKTMSLDITFRYHNETENHSN